MLLKARYNEQKNGGKIEGTKERRKAESRGA
jgi:hypothetical protein